MEYLGYILILVRVMIFSFMFIKFGIDTALFYGVLLISIDVMQIKMSIEGRNNDV